MTSRDLKKKVKTEIGSSKCGTALALNDVRGRPSFRDEPPVSQTAFFWEEIRDQTPI